MCQRCRGCLKRGNKLCNGLLHNYIEKSINSCECILNAITIRLLNEKTVESVCLLFKLHKAKHHVDVKLELDELDLTSAESKATYEEIKKYIAEHNDGMKVSSLYIAQVKKKCGLELGENFNLLKTEDAKQPQCPEEKGA